MSELVGHSQSFIQRFGTVLHDFYCAKYPLNEETRFFDIPQSWIWDRQYRLRTLENYPYESPAVEYTAHFEWWAESKDTNWQFLAFIPALNAVVVALQGK